MCFIFLALKDKFLEMMYSGYLREPKSCQFYILASWTKDVDCKWEMGKLSYNILDSHALLLI